MKRAIALLAVVGVAAVGVTSWLVADESSAGRPQDEAAIRAASQAFVKAFETGKVDDVAALFTEDGEYQDEGGQRIHGRTALAKAYGGFFAKRAELKAEGKTDSIRFLGKDTAVEEGTFTVKAKNAPADMSRYSSLYVRQDGKWLIALMKEWGDDKTDRADLNDLKWLIGTWESDGPELSARTSYEWAANNKFIHSHYTITPKKAGEKPMVGTQIIGVDPANGQIHAWLFDGEGGIGESSWSFDGERWVIDSHGTLADGSDTTAQNLMTRNGDDGFTWRSVKRTLDGDMLPDLGAVKVTRVKGGK
jgi:uncharacterized protein (TIGR02246 family)